LRGAPPAVGVFKMIKLVALAASIVIHEVDKLVEVAVALSVAVIP
jgi:hypothetical protein